MKKRESNNKFFNKLIIVMILSIGLILAAFMVACGDDETNNLVTVSFESNGGTYIRPITVEMGTVINKPTDPILEGYSFEDWYTEVELLEVYDFDMQVASNLKLYAKYLLNDTLDPTTPNPPIPEPIDPVFPLYPDNPDTDMPTIDAQDPEPEIEIFNIIYLNIDNTPYDEEFDAPTTHTNGEQTDIPKPEIIKIGYKFDGWFDTIECDGQAIEQLDSDTIYTEDIVLYLGVSPIQYEIQYSVNMPPQASNPVLGNVSNSTHSYDQAKKLNKNGYSIKGWQFMGWADTESADNSVETKYGNNESVINLSDKETTIILYAVFAPSPFTITLDKQDGIGGDNLVGVQYDMPLPNITPPTKIGYEFNGYYLDDTIYYDIDGYATIARYNELDDAVLQAKWQPKQYTIHLHYCNGIDEFGNSSLDISVLFNSSLPQITPPTRFGYEFNGFYTQELGLGLQYFDSDGLGLVNYNITNDISLYAHWTLKTFLITLNHNGGTGGSHEFNIEYLSPLPTDLIAPIYPNNIFCGYELLVNNNNILIFDGNMQPLNEQQLWDNIIDTVELNATWQSDNFKYTLNSTEDGYEIAVKAGIEIEGVLNLPSAHNGLPVVAVAKQGFTSQYKITSVNIPSTIISLGDEAFRGSSQIKDIFFNNSQLTTIGNSCFNGLSNITTMTLPATLTKIGNAAFNGCKFLDLYILAKKADIFLGAGWNQDLKSFTFVNG